MVQLLVFVSLLSPPQDDYRPIAEKDRPPLVREAIEAVRTKQALQLERLFKDVMLVGAGSAGARPLSGKDALAMLNGCTLGQVHVLYAGTYTIDYACPARRSAAKVCVNGDLVAIVSESPVPSFSLGENERTGPDCPLFVPPPAKARQ